MALSPQHPARSALLESLRAEVRRCEQGRSAGAGSADRSPVVSTGIAVLDELLPRGGLAPGRLSEWVLSGPGSGGATLALHVALRATAGRGLALVVIDPGGEFYPPAAAGLGLDLARLVIVHPRTLADTLWAWDQALRCRAVAAAWGHLERLDERAFRRLQLAAENGGACGLLLRPWQARQTPSWAEIRLAVEPAPGAVPGGAGLPAGTKQEAPASAWPGNRRLRVELLRSRSALTGRAVVFEFLDPRATRLAGPEWIAGPAAPIERPLRRMHSGHRA